MTMYADGRTDNVYNQDFLDQIDRNYLQGFDWCVRAVKNLFDGNIDTIDLSECKPEEINLGVLLEKNAEIFTKALEERLEAERDVLITGMIEGMDPEEYKKIRSEKIKENPEKYYDSRKYMFTGEKVYAKEEDV